MKKRVYMAPAIALKDAELLSLLNASITGIDGDSGLILGEGEVPETADSRHRRRRDWEDEEDEEYDW